jgi:hypothetical protein
MTPIRFDAARCDVLNLNALADGMPGITPRVGAYLAEAAVACLEQERHGPDIGMRVDGEFEHRIRLQWSDFGDPEQRARAWGDGDVATEQGAYGIAALLVSGLTDYTVVERARKGPGFDYWLGRRDGDGLLFQDKARLEVSGVRRGDDQVIASRIRRKMKQIEPSDTDLPGVVAVVEFGAPRTRVKTK